MSLFWPTVRSILGYDHRRLETISLKGGAEKTTCPNTQSQIMAPSGLEAWERLRAPYTYLQYWLHFSYFCTATFFCLNNNGKQPRRNKLKSGGTNNLRAKRAEKKLTVVRRIGKSFSLELAGRNCLQISGSAVRAPIRARALKFQPHGWSASANIFQSRRGCTRRNGLSEGDQKWRSSSVEF